MGKKQEQVKPNTRITNEAETKVREETASTVAQSTAHSPVQPRPDWSKIGRLDQNSLQARWHFEKYSIIRELWRAHCQMVTFYMKPEGGNLSLEEAIKLASEESGEGTMLDEEIQDLLGGNVKSLSWYTLDRVFRTNPSYAQQIWEEVKDQALMDFKSGHFAAALFEHTDWQKDVWKRAHFVAIFQEMVEEYNPRGAIEMSMVEMVAVQYFLWRHGLASI